MKKYFKCIIFYLFATQAIYSQSGWIETYNSNLALNRVFFVNELTGFVSFYSSSPIKRTSDGGQNWANIDSIIGYNSICFINSNTGFILKFRDIFKTTDSGINWQKIYSFYNVPQLFLTSIFFINENTGYLSAGWSYPMSGGTVFSTTNGGTNWTSITISNSDLNDIYFVNSNTGFSVSSFGQIYKTINAGNNWTSYQYYNSPNLNNISFVNDLTGYISGVQSSGTGGIIIKTIDGGNSWLINLFNLSPHGFFNIHFTGMDTGYTLSEGSNNSIFKTINGGNNWFIQNTFSGFYISDICFINASTGFCTTYNSSLTIGKLYKTTDGGGLPIGVETFVNSIVSEFNLYQNYPNPFNPISLIKYDISQKTLVNIKVYNIHGQEVKQLVDEFKQAGSYTVNFDGTNLASGVYFYRIEAGNFVDSKKMVLVK